MIDVTLWHDIAQKLEIPEGHWILEPLSQLALSVKTPPTIAFWNGYGGLTMRWRAPSRISLVMLLNDDKSLTIAAPDGSFKLDATLVDADKIDELVGKFVEFREFLYNTGFRKEYTED